MTPGGSPDHRDEIARIQAVRSALTRARDPQAAAVPAPVMYYPAPAAAAAPVAVDEDDSPHLFFDFWRLMVRHKWTVLGFMLAFLLAGYLLSFFQKRQYRASATLEVLGLNENFMNTRELDPTATSSQLYQESFIETQIKVLQSDALVDRVGRRMKLEERPEFQDKRGRLTAIREAIERDAAPRPSPVQAMRERIRENLRIKSSRTDRIIEVQFMSVDPRVAAEFPNALASEFIKHEAESRWAATERTGEFLDKSLSEMKRKMDDSELQLQTYARAADIVFTSDTDTVAEAGLRQAQDELSRAEGERMAKQSQFELVKSSPIEALPAVLDNPTLKDMQVKLTELKRDLAALTPSLKPAHYKIKQLESQISEVEKAMERERGLIANRLQNEYTAADRREKLLKDRFQSQSANVSNQSVKAVKYNLLKREAETNRRLYESMLQRVKDASVAAGMRVSPMRFVDRASVPTTPYQPKPLLNAALGSVLGLFLGVAFVVGRQRSTAAREASDRLISQPGDAVQYIESPELGVIPSAAPRVSGLSWKSMPALPAAGAEPPSAVELITWEQSRSFMAESFRATATSILLTHGDRSRPRCLVISSPNPGEGKTTSACNLAIAFAEIYGRVLLVDGDLRRPRLHSVFQVENSTGFSDLLQAEPGTHAPLAHFVRPTQIRNLTVLPSGSCEVSPASLLLRMPAVLEQMRREYDLVVVDAPPLMHLADARLLGRLADGMVLVFRSKVTASEVVRSIRQRLAEDGTKVLGTILNDWDASHHQQKYGYYYTAAAAAGGNRGGARS